jgi:hypothetical protein
VESLKQEDHNLAWTKYRILIPIITRAKRAGGMMQKVRALASQVQRT